METQRFLENQASRETQPLYEQTDVFPPADISEYHTEDSYEASHYRQDDNRHVEYENQAYGTSEQRTVTHKPGDYEEEGAQGGSTDGREVREIKYSKQRDGDRLVKVDSKAESAGGLEEESLVEGDWKSSGHRSRQAHYSDGSFSPTQRRRGPPRTQRGGSPVRKKRSEWHEICVVREDNVIS